MSDAILFALLFATYAVMVHRTAGGPSGAELFEPRSVFLTTMLLLTSSLTFGLSATGAREGRRVRTLAWLGATIILGAIFVGLEGSEFSSLIARDAGPDRSGFLSAFFTLVGMHGLHVSAGLVWCLVMAVQIFVKGLTPPVHSRFVRLGMFWHFLGIVWIGVYSVVYLAGVV